MIHLFVDGENFLHKIEDALEEENIKTATKDIAQIDLQKLISLAFPDYKIEKKNFYTAKLKFHESTPIKSRGLILKQRILKTNLEKQGFTFIAAGTVRPQQVGGKTIFKEKGVDVRIAVDLVSLSCDKNMKTAIVCSYDSDLQPAIAEIRKRGVEVIYLGFANTPNKGLTYTCNKTVLFRNNEILQAVPDRTHP